MHGYEPRVTYNMQSAATHTHTYALSRLRDVETLYETNDAVCTAN